MSEDRKSTRWVVTTEQAGTRLDKFVAEHGEVSRRVARTWIGGGRIRIKGRVLRVLTRPLRAGTVVELSGEPTPAPAAPPKTGEAPADLLLYRDRQIVVVNKPGNLLSETDRFGGPSLETVVPRVLEALGERSRLWLVHRLDAVTSGVIVMARTPGAARELNAVFREARATKTYLALVAGHLRKGKDIDGPVGRVQGTRHGVVPGGKPSHTHVAPLRGNKEATLVRATPTTGRTHQIRVHLASVELPLLGDRLYGGPGYRGEAPRVPIGRAMLHARRLELPHPGTGETMVFEAPVPEDFEEVARAFDLWESGVS